MSENEYTIENDAAPSTGDKKKRKISGKNQRWTEPVSIFLIKFMAGQVHEGVKGDLNIKLPRKSRISLICRSLTNTSTISCALGRESGIEYVL